MLVQCGTLAQLKNARGGGGASLSQPKIKNSGADPKASGDQSGLSGVGLLKYVCWN